MMPAPTRVWWAALVIAVAVLGLCFSPSALLTRLVVGMIALIAVTMGGIVLWSMREEPAPPPVEPMPEPVPKPAEPPPPLNERLVP